MQIGGARAGIYGELWLYQKERVHTEIEVQSRKVNARVAVVPHEDLHWNRGRSVEQEESIEKEHHCGELSKFSSLKYHGSTHIT
jgi:hypothetical protein